MSELWGLLDWRGLWSGLWRLPDWSRLWSGLCGLPDWRGFWSGLCGLPWTQNSQEAKGKDGLLDYGSSSEIGRFCGDLWDHQSQVLQDHRTRDHRSWVFQDHRTRDHWSQVLQDHRSKDHQSQVLQDHLTWDHWSRVLQDHRTWVRLIDWSGFWRRFKDWSKLRENWSGPCCPPPSRPSFARLRQWRFTIHWSGLGHLQGHCNGLIAVTEIFTETLKVKSLKPLHLQRRQGVV